MVTTAKSKKSSAKVKGVELREKLDIRKNAIYVKDPHTGLMTNMGYEEYVVMERHKDGHSQIHKSHLDALHGKPEKDWKKAGHDVKRLKKLKVVV